ncbi:MAG: hypothetical protein ACKVHE_20990 [Planctomycetales bacterium]
MSNRLEMAVLERISLIPPTQLPRFRCSRRFHQSDARNGSEARWLLVIKLMALRVNSQSRPADA